MSADLVEHTHVNLHETLAFQSHWSDGPEFFVLLCSAHVEVDPRLLYADARLGWDCPDPHWSVSPPADPSLTTEAGAVCDENGCPGGQSDEVQRPGGRYDACIVIASIDGEPSPKLRHLAELSGGVALPVRNAEEANVFAAACRESFLAVVASADARGADVLPCPDGPRASRPEPPDEREASAPHTCPAERVASDPPSRSVERQGQRLADQASTYLAIQDAMSKWDGHEPRADEFINVEVLIERSVAAVTADPAGSTRRAVVDALHERNVGRSRNLSTYGWGLIATYRLVYDEDLRGSIREALRGPNDHTRVDLARACSQIERLTGPAIFIVLATSLIDPFDVAITGREHDDGFGSDRNTREPVGDSQRYAKDLEGRYPTVVLLGGLDGAVRPELVAWAESTGGVAMPAGSREEIEAFAQRCAEVYREWVEQIEAECTAGLLDLDRIFG